MADDIENSTKVATLFVIGSCVLSLTATAVSVAIQVIFFSDYSLLARFPAVIFYYIGLGFFIWSLKEVKGIARKTMCGLAFGFSLSDICEDVSFLCASLRTSIQLYPLGGNQELRWTSVAFAVIQVVAEFFVLVSVGRLLFFKTHDEEPVAVLLPATEAEARGAAAVENTAKDQKLALTVSLGVILVAGPSSLAVLTLVFLSALEYLSVYGIASYVFGLCDIFIYYIVLIVYVFQERRLRSSNPNDNGYQRERKLMKLAFVLLICFLMSNVFADAQLLFEAVQLSEQPSQNIVVGTVPLSSLIRGAVFVGFASVSVDLAVLFLIAITGTCFT